LFNFYTRYLIPIKK